MRRGSEYVESLRDGRAVFLDGERVGDVTPIGGVIANQVEHGNAARVLN